MSVTTPCSSTPAAAASQDYWVKPMNNYNDNSSYQAEINAIPCKFLKEQAKELSAHFKHEFHIADFGCSHGKNSMECIKSAFDGHIGSPSFIRVYLNDLPSNDFGQVFKCLNDPAISINQHPLALKANISTCVNGLSFSNQCFPSDHLHLSLSFNCLHWLENPVHLSKALFTKSSRVTLEEAKTLSKDAHTQFVSFLKSRAQELKQGGRLVVSFLKEGPVLRVLESLWFSYIESQGYDPQDFTNIVLPAYYRSDDEVQQGIDEVQTEFRTLAKQTYCDTKNAIDASMLRSVAFNSILSGLHNTRKLDSLAKCEQFLDGFFNSFASIEGVTEYHLIVLERI
ncbi:hypothetical protein DSO57_1017899 [Entomophthora muscae]|uniref:Uncharacterized protein n=1 Tax=Entomophthora muscae TaxID=34485 RepID=A0ACC2UPJ5_9FUNG|nr:hypothetical protein DSO57_1017899 [Entomophthora muscae]